MTNPITAILSAIKKAAQKIWTSVTSLFHKNPPSDPGTPPPPTDEGGSTTPPPSDPNPPVDQKEGWNDLPYNVGGFGGSVDSTKTE